MHTGFKKVNDVVPAATISYRFYLKLPSSTALYYIKTRAVVIADLWPVIGEILNEFKSKFTSPLGGVPDHVTIQMFSGSLPAVRSLGKFQQPGRAADQ